MVSLTVRTRCNFFGFDIKLDRLKCSTSYNCSQSGKPVDLWSPLAPNNHRQQTQSTSSTLAPAGSRHEAQKTTLLPEMNAGGSTVPNFALPQEL